MEPLYRIISLEGFLSLVVNKFERFVRPIDAWEDTFEGYMLHLLDSEIGLKTVVDHLYNNITEANTNLTVMNVSKLLRSRYTCYGMCWSKVKDSDALWRIYSYDNKAIQLVSNKSRIDKLITDNYEHTRFRIQSVYYDINDEAEAINKILVKNAKVDEAYFHKRPAFKHEKEVRVLINDSEKTTNLEAFSIQAIRNNLKFTEEEKAIPERIWEAVMTLNAKESYKMIAPPAKYLKIKDLSQYIDGIRVHPMAEDWYCNLIEKLAEEHGIKYLEKSDLYRKIV